MAYPNKIKGIVAVTSQKVELSTPTHKGVIANINPNPILHDRCVSNTFNSCRAAASSSSLYTFAVLTVHKNEAFCSSEDHNFVCSPAPTDETLGTQFLITYGNLCGRPLKNVSIKTHYLYFLFLLSIFISILFLN